MRVGLALSSIVHLGVLLVAYLAFASPRLFDPTPPEAVTVDIVAADEVTKPDAPRPDPAKEKPELPKIELPKPEAAKPEAPQQEAGTEQKADQSREPKRPDRAAPSDAKTRTAADPEPKPDTKGPPAAPGAGSQPASRPGDPASSNQQMAANPGASQHDPSAAEAPPQPIYFPMMLKNLQNWAMDFDFDAMAEHKAALTPADVEAFREHLDKCWKPPAAVARAQKLRAVLRIALTPDGAMAAEPILVGASASAQGPALVDTARRALSACQPFSFLPADKYSEWKVLELNFTPRGLGG